MDKEENQYFLDYSNKLSKDRSGEVTNSVKYHLQKIWPYIHNFLANAFSLALRVFKAFVYLASKQIGIKK